MARLQRPALAVSLALALVACTRSTTAPMDSGVTDLGAVDMTPDVPVMCGTGEMLCHGACIDTNGDNANCGHCDTICRSGVTCAAGACSCMTPMLGCGGDCIDPMTDPTNCGTCGHTCDATEQCTGGTCIPGCDAPRSICYDAIAGADAGVDAGTTPVCVDTQSDTLHCGACGTRCRGGASCTAGRCACPTGQMACDGACTDVMTDPLHCGDCRTTCGPGGTCVGGTCTTCDPTYTACPGIPGCVDLMSTLSSCGACMHRCSPGETCVDGMCSCGAPRADCGTGCTDLTTDPNNCGGCGNSCGPGGACAAMTCTCAAGYMMCGAACSDVLHDRNHCGDCTTVCDPGNVCMAGTCSLAPPTHYMQTTPAAGTVPFLDACAATGHTTVLTNADDSSASTTLPFPFRYFATDLAMGAAINVCSNGFINMDGTTATSLSGTVPSTSTPNAVIAAHWGDDHTSANGVCIATMGTAPSRQLVIEWSDSYYCCTSGTVHNTFEIVLEEATGNIDLIYQTMTAARAETMGLEDQTGAMGINACPGGTGTCTPTTGQVVQFVPIP